MVLIAIITGVYKPTYNWGGTTLWHSPLRLARSIQGGSRPAWGWNFGGGVARSVRPLKLMDHLWISDPSKPCDVSICISKKSTKKKRSKTIKNYQKRSKTIKNYQKLIFQTRERPSCQLCPWESAKLCNRSTGRFPVASIDHPGIRWRRGWERKESPGAAA